MSQNDKPIVREIRRRLMVLCNARERAYREALSHGILISRLKAKKDAIRLIRIQLMASEHWTLQAHVNMINGLSELIEMILPDSGSRFIPLRRQITDMTSWCHQQSRRNLSHAA